MTKFLKRYCLIFFHLGIALMVSGQRQDSLIQKINKSIPDSNKVKLLNQLAQEYFFTKPDSCLLLSLQAIELAHQVHYKAGEFAALREAGEALRFMGNLPQALEIQFRAWEISRNSNNKISEAAVLGNIGFIYVELKEYGQALHYLLIGKEIYDQLGNDRSILNQKTFSMSSLGSAYEGLGILDSALSFQKQANTFSIESGQRNLQSLTLRRLAKIYQSRGDIDLALQHYRKALENSLESNDGVNPAIIQIGIAEIFQNLKQEDSILYYARGAYLSAQKVSQKLRMLEASKILIQEYKNAGNLDSILVYQDIAINLKDSLFGPEKFRQLQLLSLKEQKRQQELIQQQVELKNKSRVIAILLILAFSIFTAGLLYRNNLRKQKLNVLLEMQKNEIQESFSKLKTTQAQLIQSEKMASLGELTAGIAHEIQNPLNFVNNFSEVNSELIKELKNEAIKGNLSDVINLSDEIEKNSEKITHHGKRADGIVKSMLQHSRTIDQNNKNKKEPSNINVLADEYLRLAYHAFQAGLMTKDKGFNAIIKTDFDDQLGLVDIVSQDIARVILNVINNAFYTIHEKAKKMESTGQIYSPTVSVSTKRLKDTIEIRIRDNGSGIPQLVLDKIFQPFFTTKPTGQGIGLGLSLAYDIIKAHGGELNVKTQVGEGSEFIIQLPA